MHRLHVKFDLMGRERVMKPCELLRVENFTQAKRLVCQNPARTCQLDLRYKIHNSRKFVAEIPPRSLENVFMSTQYRRLIERSLVSQRMPNR